MNKIYKVIWSHVKQCYVVTSELAKTHGRTSTRGRTSRLAVAALTAFILTAGVTSVGLAADKDIVDKGAQPIAYDINPANDGTNIAVGKNAKVFIGGGTQESMLSFGEEVKVYNFGFSMHIHDNNHAKQNLPEGIAVGTNSYARTGSIEIGAHTLGKNNIKIGDATVSLVPEKDANGNEKKDSEGNIIYKESLPQFGVGSTTLGTNSYTGGGFATTIGSYNVQSSPYEAKNSNDTLYNATKNAFATVIGTFNSNESLSSYSPISGVANMIAGTANKVTNSNGAIVMGAGNSVKNSSAYFDATAYSTHFDSVTDMQKALMDGVASSAGGATLVIGGANQAENTSHSQIMGVGNKVKSTTSNKIEYNYLDGFESSITDASHVKVLGQKVTINKGADSNTVFGDYRTVAEGQTNNVIIGNADEKNPITTEKKETVILGYNANATVDGGVAIGSGSIANVGADQQGYYIKHDQRSEEGQGYPFKNNDSAWISRAGAVSVGDTTNEDQSKWITRQITGVAAGTNDTDAVNVAQLKNSQTRFYSIYDPGDNWLDIFPQIPNWEKYKNEDNQGAQGYYSMAAGFGTSTGGIASTVIGSMSKIDNKWTDGGPNGTQGATAVSVGTLNFNLSDQVTDEEVNSDDPRVIFQSKENSGVANSIVGQGNLTKNSNGALIYGAGNIVTDSYRRVVANGDNDLESLTNQDMESLLSNPEKAIKTLGKIVDISGGKVMVMGGGNVVDKAYDSQVMGVGNTVVGDAINFEYKESPEVSNLPENTADEQFLKEASRDADVWTQYMGSIRKQGTLLNLVDGYYSTLKNGQNDYLIGTANEVTGDDASRNKSNIVFGDYHKLNNGNNNIIIGSADGAVVEKAKGYHEDYESGIITSQEITGQKQHTENLEDAVMIGHNADVQKNGGVALGAGSVASVDKDVVGYDLAKRDHSGDTTGVWKSKAAAVSVGQIIKNEQGQLDAEKTITRQITGVAAGSEDTDAVNVAQLKAISNTVDASKTKYYSVRDMPYQLGTYATYTNEANDGAKEMGALSAGYMTYAGGIASTVTGSLSGIINRAAAPGSKDFRGATALSYGTFNINNNTENSGAFSGVANSIVGQANMTTDSNAALIYGAGNVISNSYRDIYTKNMDAIMGSVHDPKALGEALQAAVPTSGGQVMAFGGGNVVDNAYMTQVIGVGNTVKGNQKKNDDGIWSSDGTVEFKDATSSQLNYVDGFYTTLINGKNDYLIGAHNTVTGDSVEKNHSNIVIGDNHTLENRSNNIILGSADSALPTTASQVTILGHNANAKVDGGVALGYGSIASTDKEVAGYDPLTGIASTSKDKTWKSNWAAASIGDSTHTRQLTNVAAGWADTDAVNVAQLRAVASKVGSVMNLVAGDGISIVNKDGVYTISANIKGGSTPTDDVKVDPEKPGEGGNTSGSTTDTPVTPVDPGNTGNTENLGNTDNPSNGSGLIITAETKPTHFGADSGDATAVKPGETLAIKGDTTNITTTASDHGITVSLKKDIAVDSVTAGDTKMTSDGLTITGGPSITKSGIDAGGKKVTHVADGEIAADSKDAVNGSQLYRVQKNVESIENNVTNLAGDVTNLNGRVSDLDNRVNKVGAGAAALAALHPLDFNPDDKWNFAVGYGNYRNANSVAVGAFYQPNENTMFNVATNFGNGENMINAGVSFKIGKGNSYAGISKAQLVAENQQLKENDALQDQKIQKQDQEIQELKKALEELKSRIK